ncbi:MAG TPA: Calx-beta domain-containing protein [Verrucomicrobiae bacterium]|jgi:hypothetical protein|nr:Calx-beta domain-containing protein [Verrucomicrobiae bacterium]
MRLRPHVALAVLAGVWVGLGAISARGQVTRTWVGASGGDWYNAANWSPAGLPGATDILNVSNVTVVPGTGSVVIGGQLNCAAVWLKSSDLEIDVGATLNISGDFSLGGSISDSGTVNWLAGNMTVAQQVENHAGSVWNINCDNTITATIFETDGGIVRKFGTTGTTVLGAPLNNFGLVDVEGGRLSLTYFDFLHDRYTGAYQFGLNGASDYGQIMYQGAPDMMDSSADVTVVLNNGYVPRINDAFHLMQWGGKWDGVGFTEFGGVENYPAGFGWQVNWDFDTNNPAPEVTLKMTNYVGPPVITNQLRGATVSATYPITLGVGAYGAGTIKYQWFFNGAPVSKATNAILTLSNVTAANFGAFYVQVSNGYGSATSFVAQLTVVSPLTVKTFADLEHSGSFVDPQGVSTDGAGDVLYSDYGDEQVRELLPNGQGANPLVRFQGDNPGGPRDAVMDAAGNLFVSYQANTIAGGSVVKVSTNGAVVTLGGGSGTFSPVIGELALDPAGNIFLVDTGSNVIRELTKTGNSYTASIFAGTGLPGGAADGARALASFYAPRGIALDGNGNIYITDTGNHTIRQINSAGVVMTIAGQAGVAGVKDGLGLAAQFSSPEGIVLDALGNIYVADTGNNAVRELIHEADGWRVCTVAGYVGGQYGNQDGAGANAELHSPRGIGIDAHGNLFVADDVNESIREAGYAPSASLAGTPLLWALGTSTNLSSAVAGTEPLTYQWLLNGNPVSGATNSTLTVVSAGYADAGSYQLAVTNVYGACTSAAMPVTVMAAPAVYGLPAQNLAAPGQSFTLQASVAGDGPIRLQWSFDGTNILNATNLQLTLNAVTQASAGTYAIVGSNAVGSSTQTLVLTIAGVGVTAGNINGTWTAANSPYVLNSDMTVSGLNVQPGVSLWANGSYTLTVTGLLTVVGTSNNPVVFDGVTWQGVAFQGADPASSLTWAVVKDAGNSGIRCVSSPLALTNCVIAYNTADSGGGISTDTNLWLQNCQILNNISVYPDSLPTVTQGGGLYVAGGAVTLQSCLLSNNLAQSPFGNATGGGLDLEAGSATLVDCTVVSNTASAVGSPTTGVGGGIYSAPGAALHISGSTFFGNKAVDGFGGGVAAAGAASYLTTIFSQNSALYGGALYLGGQTAATNCLLTGNLAAGLGGAVAGSGTAGAGVFENCTVANNAPDGFFGFAGLIHDAIVWGNGINTNGGIPMVAYSDVAGGFAGVGNINTDPQFLGGADASYLLGDASPCIDAGDPASAYNDEAFPPSQANGFDLDDMGAYGGPDAAFWPQFAAATPVILVNGQPAAPYQTFTFVNTSQPTISFQAPFANALITYSLDGSNPAGAINFDAPFLLQNSAVIRVWAYSIDSGESAISAPVIVNLPPAYAFSAGSDGGGSVSPVNGLQLSNTMVSLTATPSNGWQFLYWTNGVSGTDPALKFVLSQPLPNVKAVFGTALSLHIAPLNFGAIASNPVAALYPYGARVQLTATPTTGHYFIDWVGGASGAVSPLDLTVTSPGLSVTAQFANQPANTNVLNLAVVGGGDVTRTPQQVAYATGANVQVTATPLPGYMFTGWSGGASGSVNPLSVTLNANVSITANFVSTNAPAVGPPLLAITNPPTGTIFQLPATITIKTSAHDTNSNGGIAQVVFFNGATNLGTVTNAPFDFAWSNAPAGTNLLLTAVAVNNSGLAATSAPVAVTTLTAPPGPAAFTLDQSAYTVFENAGNLTITVRKSPNSLGGAVNYSTTDGTARAGTGQTGNYEAASGHLVFAADDTAKSVTIPIFDLPVYVGNTTFNFALASSLDGSSVGNPGSAAVTIVEVNLPSTTNSVLQNGFPSSAPPSQGSLQVFTTPSGAQGQWRLLWEGVWHNSGDIITGLPTGIYPVTFSPVANFVAPDVFTNSVISGSLTVMTNQYAATGVASYGTLSVTLYPPGIGQWRVVGETTWRASGYVESNLVSGDHIIEFNQALNYVKPAPLVAYVGGGQDNTLSATYLIEEQGGATAPSLLQFSTASTTPYFYNGQLLTDVGYGSGCVVQPRVVLTAAHLVFDAATLGYVNNINWFFGEYAGTYNPPAQTPAGVYVFSGYAAARTNDLNNGGSPDAESTASQNADVAALYFFDDAGRHGYSGYLVSQPGATPWLQTSANKMLIGYPVDNVSPVNRMYNTSPFDVEFSLVANQVYQTADIIGYGGNSGGTVFVAYTNQNNSEIYYPAGVYLGGSSTAIVRAIDGDVADLINRGNVSAATGVNHAGGGVVTVSYNQSGSTGFGFFKVTLAPPGVVSAGAAWKIVENPGSAFANDGAAHALAPGTYTLSFAAATGYVAPANQTLKISANQTASLTATYGSVGPSARFAGFGLTNGFLTLSLTTANGQKFALETSTNLVTWRAVLTNTAASNGSLSFTNNTATNNSKAAFFRVRYVP